MNRNLAARLAVTMTILSCLSGCSLSKISWDFGYAWQADDCNLEQIANQGVTYGPGNNVIHSLELYSLKYAGALACRLRERHGGTWEISPNGDAVAQQNYEPLWAGLIGVALGQDNQCRQKQWKIASMGQQFAHVQVTVKICKKNLGNKNSKIKVVNHTQRLNR